MKFTVYGVGSVAPAFSGCPANERQRRLLSERVVERFGPDLSGQVITLRGLAFEPGTDDMREAPGLTIVDESLRRGANAPARESVAMPRAALRAPVLFDDRNICDPQSLASTGFESIDIGRGAPITGAANDRLNAAPLRASAT